MTRRIQPSTLATGGLLLLAIAWQAGGTAARAAPQAPAGPAQQDDHPSYFSKLFPNPTGTNGYEDLVAAADLLRDNHASNPATADGATLSQKRQALADPDCRRALLLIRNGLSKPMESPRSGQQLDMNTLLPDLQLLRRLGRLLAVEQYVFLADGRTGAAINSLSDSLRIPDAVSGETLIGSLVAAAIGGVNLYPFSYHSAQWSSVDCEHILQLVRDRMAANPDPGAVAIAAEKKMALRDIDEIIARMQKADWSKLAQDFADSDGQVTANLQAQWLAVANNPSAQALILAQVRQKVSDAYDQAIAQDPFAPPPAGSGAAAADVANAPPPATLADAVAQILLPDLPHVRRVIAGREQIPLLLLGTHAAIRRYRWEYGRLPASLDDVKMPDITTDPYTGKPMEYAPSPDGSGYTLACAAPPKDANGIIAPARLPPNGNPWQ